jgi:error-prone DNA polymerase
MLSELMANGNCTLLIGPDSDVGRQVVAGNRTMASALLENWHGLFKYPGSFGIEIVSHLTQPGTVFSSLQARRMVELADANNIPAVLTNAVRYLEPDDALTADVLDAARHLEALGLFEEQPNAQAWMKPTQKMLALAIEITEDRGRALELFEVTAKLAERCRLDPPNDCGWGKPKTPEQSALGITGNPFEVLWQKAHAGIERYYPDANDKLLQQVQHRLGQELITINKLGFATYFLTVAEVRW